MFYMLSCSLAANLGCYRRQSGTAGVESRNRVEYFSKTIFFLWPTANDLPVQDDQLLARLQAEGLDGNELSYLNQEGAPVDEWGVKLKLVRRDSKGNVLVCSAGRDGNFDPDCFKSDDMCARIYRKE